jgi:hypothetical protein
MDVKKWGFWIGIVGGENEWERERGCAERIAIDWWWTHHRPSQEQWVRQINCCGFSIICEITHNSFGFSSRSLVCSLAICIAKNPSVLPDFPAHKTLIIYFCQELIANSYYLHLLLAYLKISHPVSKSLYIYSLPTGRSDLEAFLWFYLLCFWRGKSITLFKTIHKGTSCGWVGSLTLLITVSFRHLNLFRIRTTCSSPLKHIRNQQLPLPVIMRTSGLYRQLLEPKLWIRTTLITAMPERGRGLLSVPVSHNHPTLKDTHKVTRVILVELYFTRQLWSLAPYRTCRKFAVYVEGPLP